jgi:predicted CopG family antitoxin
VTQTGEFSEDEWQSLRRLPLVAASIISAVDYSTMSESKEYEAFADFIRKSSEKRRQSDFVAMILDETVAADLQTFQSLCTSVATAMSGEKPVDRALAEAGDIARMLDQRLDKKAARAYKEFVLDVALAVARAHKESALPFASPISTVEDFHIRRLSVALGV